MTNNAVRHKPLIVWRMSDFKAGHDSQSVGLVAALDRITPVSEYVLAPARASMSDLLFRHFPPGAGLPDPDLLIGAGHATHVALVAAQRARGGRTIVLMKPTIPLSVFDLCIIPEHDSVSQKKNVILTRGVLNTIRAQSNRSAGNGLILIGGPSKHFGWSNTEIVAQVGAITASTPETDWMLATSRRTPSDFLKEIRQVQAQNLKIVPVEDTKTGWVAEQMARSDQIWVSEDSASMVYEALSSGAGVGVLSCPIQGSSRISEGVRKLRCNGDVTAIADWEVGQILPPPSSPLCEADRCARWIANKWFASSTVRADVLEEDRTEL